MTPIVAWVGTVSTPVDEGKKMLFFYFPRDKNGKARAVVGRGRITYLLTPKPSYG